MLKIAHITDTHIAPVGEKPKGIDSLQRFLDVLEQISRGDFDILIHTGDISYPEGSRESYQWMKEQLDGLDIPYYLRPGNHDDVLLMQEVFKLKDLPPREVLNGVIAARGQSLMFLDSSSERLSVKQASWLAREIEVQEDDLFLFMHHPPCSCGVKVMDSKYPYKTSAYFQKIAADSGRSLTLFTGHYHIEKTVTPENTDLTVHISPPTFGSLDPDSEDYSISDERGGWREIVINKQKLITTDCRYLD
ncbi:MAG: metallophosphoesterase [Spirochaetales bacterium]|nr:metallophosphoesterase [Spirochaetales bacterium]